ncbi:hypothetical protein IFM47457_10766 [Aspergillus lentulus]|nr:hypothetical protein IFM47457_10766 [Aspergillus lentulus]
MGKFSHVLMPWRRGAKYESRGKRITQNDPPERIPARGATQKCSQNFQLVLRPKEKPSDIDQKIFKPDGTLRPGWRVEIERVPTKRGWEYVYVHLKTGGSYADVDLIRRRGDWREFNEEMKQKALASKFTPCYGGGGGFPW